MKMHRLLSMSLLGLTMFGGLVLSQSAQALVELRAHYGVQASSPEQAVNHPELGQLKGFGADLIISPPLFPLAFGLRYEQLKQDETNDVASIDVKVNRLAALGSMRLIDTLIFIGAIGTVGLDHSGTYSIDVAGTTVGDYNGDPEIGFSYSVGLEAGVKLVGFLLGAEAGYMGLTMEGGGTDTKLDGAYVKAHIGVGF